MVRAGSKTNGNGIKESREHRHWLAFSSLRGIGPKRFSLLLAYFGSAKTAWEASQKEWRQLGLGEVVVEEWQSQKNQFASQSVLIQLKNHRVKPVFLDQPDYPTGLKNLANPPFVIYLQGSLNWGERLIAVVGTRRMTSYGEQVTESLVTELVLAGVTVVSGLARGIDGVAHRAAIKAGGKTIGVLGSGHACFYPAENAQLSGRMVETGGAIVSEYPPETTPQPGFFPARNRLITALSRGVVVVEGGLKSGSLITARLAADQGKEVFAVPGPIFNPGSQGPAFLVQSGAKLVTKAADILEEFGWDQEARGLDSPNKPSYTIHEQQIIDFLQTGPVHVNLLARKLNWPVGEVTGLLTMMELKKIVLHMGSTSYRLNK